MFSKLIKKVFKETTNIADVSPVTFNATGNYNPRYGKQHVYVSGKAEDGSTSPGSAYYNYVAGTPFDNSYYNAPIVVAPLSGVKVGTNSYTYGTYWVNYTTLSPTSSGQYYNGRQDLASGTNLYNNYAATPYSAPFVPSTYTVMGFVPPSYTIYPFNPTWADVYGNVPGSTTPGTLVPGNSGTYAASYPYAGSYSPSYYTGSSTTVFGVPIAGGISTTASVVPLTLVNAIPVYGTPVQITVPPGGYVNITFKL